MVLNIKCTCGTHPQSPQRKRMWRPYIFGLLESFWVWITKNSYMRWCSVSSQQQEDLEKPLAHVTILLWNRRSMLYASDPQQKNARTKRRISLRFALCFVLQSRGLPTNVAVSLWVRQQEDNQSAACGVRSRLQVGWEVVSEDSFLLGSYSRFKIS